MSNNRSDPPHHTVDELIDLLTSYKEIYGNSNIRFWSEETTECVFDDLKTLFYHHNGALYFGGFNLNSDEYKDMPTDNQGEYVDFNQARFFVG